MATSLSRTFRFCQHVTRSRFGLLTFSTLENAPACVLPHWLERLCFLPLCNTYHSGGLSCFVNHIKQPLCLCARGLVSASTAELLPVPQDLKDNTHLPMTGKLSSARDEFCDTGLGCTSSFGGESGPTANAPSQWQDKNNEVELKLRAQFEKLGIADMGDMVDYKVLARCTEDELVEKLSFLIRIGVVGKRLVYLACHHPSLLAMDLVKGLTPVLECMELFGLDKSVLGEVLVLEPDLAVPLTEKALEDRLQALEDLDFSRDDIAAFLKVLSRKQLGQFVGLPMEKIETVWTFVTTVSPRKDQVIKLVKSSPTFLFRDVQQDFLSKLEALKSIFCDSKKARKIFAHLPELLGRKTEALEETVLYLKSIAADTQELSKLIETSPVVLIHSKKALQQVFDYLQSLGFASNRAVALIAVQPYLITCESKRLQKHVDFLRSKELDDQAICNLMESSTEMFFRSLERRLAPKIEFFENQGITGESLQKFFKSRPQTFRKSLRNSMAPNLKFLLDLGFQESTPSLSGALKVTLSHSCKSMQSRINHLVGLGIERDKVLKIVRETPSVLITTDSRVQKNIDFLVKTMKRSVQEVVKCPSFLVCNLESIMKPRVRVLEWLKACGLSKDLPLSTIVETTEESFVKQFVEPYPQVSHIYRGTSQQA